MTMEKVRGILAKQLDVDPARIHPETNIFEDLGADSLDVVELLMELEEAYGIVITDEKAAGVRTVGEVARFLEKQLG